MQKPAPLGEGQKAGLVALSSPVKKDYLKKGLENFSRFLRVKPVLPVCLHSKHFFTTCPSEKRWEDLKTFLQNPEIRAIWALRGGAGSWQILEFLENHPLPEKPKIIAGASDFTFILLYFLQKWNWVVFFAPMVATKFASMDLSEESLRSFTDAKYRFEKKLKVIKEGKGRGILTGGTLSILVSTLATPYELETRGKILLIEDYREKPYRVERMLWQLKKAGKFDEIQGIVFSDMPECIQHPEQGYDMEELLRNFFQDAPFPVLFGLKTGHSKKAETLALGIEYEIEGDRFRSLEGAVLET